MSTLLWTQEFSEHNNTLYVSTSRRLPHIHPEGKWLFVTWCLNGCVPRSYPPPGKLSAGQAFVWMDRHLDRAKGGPLYLKQRPVAELVINALHSGVFLRHYDLGPFVVMANHVHVLLLPQIPAEKLLKSLKGSSARTANRLPGTIGQPFWQAESYDHWVRSDEEFNRITRYIENNPVTAGIVLQAEDYPWSSAHAALSRVHRSVDTAGRSACATRP